MYRYTLSLYEKAMPDGMKLTQKLLEARECGYDGVEICIDAYPQRAARLDWSDSQIGELARFLTGNDLRVATVSLSLLRSCPLGTLDNHINEKALSFIQKGFRICRGLGAEIMLINGYDVYDSPSTPKTAERFGENLSKAVELAAAYGVVLGLENAEMPFIDSIAKAARWVKRIDSPYLRIYGDVGNSFNAMRADTGKVLNDFEAGRGNIAAVHLKDSLPGQYRFVRYGGGHVDFAVAVPLLMEMDVRIFTAEQFWQPDTDWRAEAVRINRFLRGFLDRGL